MTVMADNLIRSREPGDAVRADSEGDGLNLHGHFTVFGKWTEVNSLREGHFMEINEPGMFEVAFKDTSRVRVQYDHGMDGQIGEKPIAAPAHLREDDIGAAYGPMPLFDAPYAMQLAPGLRAGQFGASYRFGVTADKWSTPSEPTEHNPLMLKERRVQSVGDLLHEFGPVNWGQYPDATSGLRSGTDEYFDRLLSDPQALVRLTNHYGPNIAQKIVADGTTFLSKSDDAPSGLPPSLRRRALALLI